MRNFLVNVNGTQYEVAVEEIDGKAAPKALPFRQRPLRLLLPRLPQHPPAQPK